MINFKFKKGDLVRVEKISDEVFNGKHPNEINVGYFTEGILYEDIFVEDCCYVGWLRTSPVVEIISEDTFKTMNSIYKLSEKVDLILLEIQAEELVEEINNMSKT